MDRNQTQPINTQRTVNYRCVCGAELRLDIESGGECPSCQKQVSSRLLKHDRALSLTVEAGHVDVAATAGAEMVLVRQPDELIGKMLGHFELQALLGRGGMGLVYRALDTSLQRYVAVKVLRRPVSTPDGKSQTDGLVDKLLQEAVTQARVNHPNIVAIYYVGRESGDPFLAMELVQGKTAAKHVESSGSPFPEIASVAIQIAEALRVSYELDLIHGDIKPSNILVQTNGVAKLSDFGMARRVSNQSEDVVGGTPNYLAPELLVGARPTVQSDMYALGVTLYEMTFSKLPVVLSGSSLKEWAASHAKHKIEFPTPWPEALPDKWRGILNKLMNSKPEGRYESYDMLIRDLQQVMPVRSAFARPLPRMIAAFIDHFLVATVMTIVILVAYLLQSTILGWLDLGKAGVFTRFTADLPWYLELARILISVLFALAGFLPIFLYSLWIGYRRQSIGRALMHIRVFNRYGLRPSARLMMTRDALRMIWFWVLPTILFFQSSDFWATGTTAIIASLTGLFWLVDISHCLFSRSGRALHDRLLETNVVLDTEQWI